ncbi:unnamed protein product [Prorocentrum cordatum]|uniref:Cytoplasmic dynein 2 light intermediate chain 1 n=1 Tax=Prorocentrum cordatum TaxID=2364126 RepID=A0ABN9SA50_9DINO|nr:unnamed protein product [Polarella glacialis]
MPAPAAKKAPPQDDDSSSILARLTSELKQSEQPEENGTDVTILFCGAKRAGKTSLIDRYINPQKDEKDVPKPTVALDYKYARHTVEGSASKVLAHIYDLSGTDVTAEVLSIPVCATSAGNLVLAVVVDLSEPHSVLPSLERWLQQLRAQANKSLDALAKEPATGAKRVEAVRAARLAAFEGHADLAQMQPFPVPLVILGAKWDVLAGNDVTPEQRKSLCRALRFFAHSNGAHLVFTSLKDKTAMGNVRNLLRWLLFGVPPSKKRAALAAPGVWHECPNCTAAVRVAADVAPTSCISCPVRSVRVNAGVPVACDFKTEALAWRLRAVVPDDRAQARTSAVWECIVEFETKHLAGQQIPGGFWTAVRGEAPMGPPGLDEQPGRAGDAHGAGRPAASGAAGMVWDCLSGMFGRGAAAKPNLGIGLGRPVSEPHGNEERPNGMPRSFEELKSLRSTSSGERLKEFWRHFARLDLQPLRRLAAAAYTAAAARTSLEKFASAWRVPLSPSSSRTS